MRKFRLFSVVALAGFLLAVVAGCGNKTSDTGTAQSGEPASKAPTELASAGAPVGSAPAAAGAVKMPAAPVVNNPDVYVMARLREPNKFLDKLGEWISTVQPMMNAEMLRNQISMMGLDLKELHPGEGLAAFMLAPIGGTQPPSGVTLIPVGPNSQTVAALKQRMGDAVTTVGEHTLVGMGGAEAAARAKQVAPALIELNKAPAANDLQAYVNVAAIMEKFGPMLTQKIQALQMFLGAMAAQQQGGNPEQMARLQQILGAEIQGLLDLLNQVQFVNLGIDLDGRLEISSLMGGKAGSGLEKSLSKPAPPDMDMTAYINPDALARGQVSFRDLQGMIDIYMKYLGLMLGPGQEQNLAKLKADLADLGKLGMLYYGIGVDISPQGKLIQELVVKCDNNDLFMDLVGKKMTEWISSGAVHEIYKSFGMDAKMTGAPTTRKVDGLEVTHYAYSIDMTSATAEQREQFKKLMGEAIEVELAKVGEFVALTVGEPVDALAKRIQSKQAGPPLEARKVYPGGGSFYLDLSIAGMIKAVKATAPADQAMKLPDIPAGTPPLTFAAFHGNGMGWYRFGLSRDLLKAIAPQQQQQPGLAPVAPGSAPAPR